jgi:hypothetical protein
MSISEFHDSLHNNNYIIAKTILQSVNDINNFCDSYYDQYDPPLFVIIRNNNMDLLKMICSGSDSEFTQLFLNMDSGFASLLPELCKEKKYDMIKIILDSDYCDMTEINYIHQNTNHCINYAKLALENAIGDTTLMTILLNDSKKRFSL